MKPEYRLPVNTINLTTVEATEENKSYVIDQRLLNVLLERVTKGSLTDIQNDLHDEISKAVNKEDLFERLDNYIYLDKIVGKLEDIELGNKPNVVGHIDLDKRNVNRAISDIASGNYEISVDPIQ